VWQRNVKKHNFYGYSEKYIIGYYCKNKIVNYAQTFEVLEVFDGSFLDIFVYNNMFYKCKDVLFFGFQQTTMICNLANCGNCK
jgi:hypothetical protein